MMLGLFTPFFYLPTYAVYHGMSTTLASYLISILNGMSLFGRLIPGILADKFGPLNMLCCSALSTGILIFAGQGLPAMHQSLSSLAYMASFSGAIVSSMTVSLSRVPKDSKDMGSYIGMGMATVSLAALAGPPINGALVTHYESFDQASIFSGIFALAGGFSILLPNTCLGVVKKV